MAKVGVCVALYVNPYVPFYRPECDFSNAYLWYTGIHCTLVWLIFLFDSTQSQKVLIYWYGSTHDSQWFYNNWFKSTRLKMDLWNVIQIDSWLKKLPEFWFKSTLTKCFQNLDSNQLLTRWCYSFPVSHDLFWAFS